MFVGVTRNIVTIQIDCFYQYVVSRLGPGMTIYDYKIKFVLSEFFRTHSMEAKHELFWTQTDFGYVKDAVDSMMKLCKPQHKVRCVCA